MEENAEQRQQRRELRGSLLRTARRVFGNKPDTLTLESLHRGVGRHDWPERTVREEVNYLMAKGYLETDQRKSDVLDQGIAVYRLTGKGVDVLNGDLADAAVEVM